MSEQVHREGTGKLLLASTLSQCTEHERHQSLFGLAKYDTFITWCTRMLQFKEHVNIEFVYDWARLSYKHTIQSGHLHKALYLSSSSCMK